MKNLLLYTPFILILLRPSPASAQSVTWAEHVAPIVYKHCTSCHRPGEIGPFPLTNYREAAAWGNMIKYVTGIRYMPPWKADSKFGASYIGANYLSDAQIATIRNWVDSGMPRGDASLEPPSPAFPKGSQVGTPDLTVSFAKKHVHKGNGQDEYRYFVLPTGLKEAKDLVALEMRPGNSRIVHHALVWADTTGSAARIDAQTPEYGYAAGQGGTGAQINFGQQLPAYVPGARPNVFNNGMAQRLSAGSDLVVQVHYAPTSTDEPDSSTFNLFFADKPASRFVRSHIMLPFSIVNGLFVLYPNTVREFQGVYKVPTDISLLGIAPHCHLLGKKWRVYAITPARDTVPLINIEDWDFNWQGVYHFKKLLYLPKNTEIHAFATYDNTVNNPLNPYNPPRFVTWGEGTADEMYYLPLLWVPYQPGDENLSMEGPATNENQVFHFNQNKLYPISPNPVRGPMRVGFTLAGPAAVSIDLRDQQGRLLQNMASMQRALPGEHAIEWDNSHLPSGIYYVTLRADATVQTQQLIVP